MYMKIKWHQLVIIIISSIYVDDINVTLSYVYNIAFCILQRT